MKSVSPRTRRDAVLRHLRRNATTTVATLATATGASRRTILRDIVVLRDEGFVIHSEPGRGGGLQLDPQSAGPAARLTVTEVFALLVSVSTMRAARALPFAGLADAALARIERTLPADTLRDLRRMLDALHVGELSPLQDLSDMGPIDTTLLPAFETAFLDRRPLTFAYRDAKGAQTRRTVEPQALLILPPLWYVVAWDPARDDFRQFRMDRITDPQVTDGPTFRRRHVPFEADVCPWRARGGQTGPRAAPTTPPSASSLRRAPSG
jgi:predicted DNA-binding transcriptional regulator YafY